MDVLKSTTTLFFSFFVITIQKKIHRIYHRKGGEIMCNIYYADHSATTYVKEEVLAEMLPYFHKYFGNASSHYSIGIKSKEALDKARCKVATAIGARSDEIYFTSGGSEADNMILAGIATKYQYKGKHIITSKIEHKAILNTCHMLEKEGFEVTYLEVDEKGFIKIDQLLKAIKEETILISIMFANNEIGTIQDIETIGNIAKENNIFFHTDAVQAIGNIPIDVHKLNIDLLSLSAHKFYGPKGVGCAYMKRGIEIIPLIHGGHQEFSKRAGTENVAGIVGLSKAIEIATNEKNIQEYNQKLLLYRNTFIDIVKKELTGIRINGSLTNRLAGNVNLSIQGIDSQTLLAMLNMEGICASSGSACNSNEVKPSHVLMAIGLDPITANSTLRFTFGDSNTLEDIEVMAYKLVEIVKKLRMTKNHIVSMKSNPPY